MLETKMQYSATIEEKLQRELESIKAVNRGEVEAVRLVAKEVTERECR